MKLKPFLTPTINFLGFLRKEGAVRLAQPRFGRDQPEIYSTPSDRERIIRAYKDASRLIHLFVVVVWSLVDNDHC